MVERAATATASKEGSDPLIGRVINDKFKILSFIARGGMGKVYRAEQAPLGRVCALKVLNANYTGDHDPEFHKRFFLEASLTSKLRHPNTVTIFDYGQTEDGIYYMAMEYLEGYTLHRAIRQVGHLPEDRTIHIARQICRSLREAHSLGVVHRDLKPANVYLLEHGDEPDFVKVLDFGLVKDATAGAEELTQAGLFMGSPKYMAPEQIQGGTVDGRTDIYALGIMMYEMITGKVPFDHAKSLEILMMHVREPPAPMRKVNPAVRVSPALEETILRAMAKDQNERFRSMDEVLAALKRLGPLVAPEPSASLTADRPSTTGSGPTASRIVRGAGAALAVPQTADGPAPGSVTGEVSIASAALAPAPVPAIAQPAKSGSPLPLIVAVVGVIALGLSLAYAMMHAGGASHATAAAPASSQPAAVTGTQAAASGAPSAAPSAAAPPDAKPVAEVDFNALSPSSAAPAAPAAPQAPAKPASAAPSRPQEKPRPAAASPAPPPAPAKPPAAAAPPAGNKPAADCNPSYYYDADGNKHFKPECFGH
jgi:serine/threonine-protein kinase